MKRIRIIITTLLAVTAAMLFFAPGTSAHNVTRATSPALVLHSAHVVRITALCCGDSSLNEAFGPEYVSTDGILTGGAGETGPSPGREISPLALQNGNYQDPAGNCPTGGCAIYQFQLGNGNCIADSNGAYGSTLTIKVCAGSNGVNWAILCHQAGCNDGYDYWINDYASTQQQADSALTGTGTDDLDLTVYTLGSPPAGDYQVWNTKSVP